MSRFFKSAAFPILIVVVLAFFAQKLIGNSGPQTRFTYGNLIQALETGQPSAVQALQINDKDNTADVTLANGHKYTVGVPNNNAEGNLITLAQKQITNPSNFDVQGTGSSGWLSLLTYILPFIIFIGFWIFLMNQVQGGGSKVMSFGKSRAKRMSVDSPKITFRDVAGVDEAVEELHEIKEFLENPKKFQALGARIPKGVLLYGPPAPARRCWLGPWPARPGCPSSRSRARTSWRCSWASVPRVSAICSSRPSRTAPASSSWTRSTPSAATGEPGWAAGTTSASRR
jgi:cell division protease FtsH